MQQLKVSKEKWEKEFSNGRWNCLDANPTERARSSIIGMYCQLYFPKGTILDVGCGLGTLIDFLNPKQKQSYLGIDISARATALAKRKKINVKNIDFIKFESVHKYDLIIFNEVLYYMDDKLALERAVKLLNKGGKIILSLYRMKKKRYDKKIFTTAHKLLKTVEAVEISGVVKKQSVTWRVEVLGK